MKSSLQSRTDQNRQEAGGPVWRKASRSQGAGEECVELAALDETIGVRDSKNPATPGLAFSRNTFGGFALEVKQGRHDRG